jgi:predicted ester cyclase
MTTDDRTIVERVFRALDGNKWDEMRELAPASAKMHLAGQTLDREGWIGFSQMFFTGFPDGRHDHEHVVAAGDHVTLTGTFRGTHTGVFQGLPPTGRAVALSYVAVVRLVEQRPVEIWAQFDSIGLMAQIGALPDPNAAQTSHTMLRAAERGDWDECRRYVSSDVRAYIGAQTFDLDGWMGMGKAFMSAFPDAHHEIHHTLVSGDRVTTIATFSGTHRGAFMGLPPTGKRVAFSVIHVDRVIDGKIVEHRGEFDPTTMMKQLGA